MSTYVAALRPAVRVLAVAVALALAATGLGVLTATSASASVTSMSSGHYEKRVQYWINVKRVRHGLPRLQLQSCTDGTAERWAQHLAANNAFYHQDMGNILNRCNAYYAGETLGRGSITPRRLVRLWMHSPPHKDVLLSRYARRIGVGAYVDSNGQWVTAANFTRF